MSKITPRPYYKCDYCATKSDSDYYFKYTDNSGYNNQCYDMCSDKCFLQHLKFIKTNKLLGDYTVGEYIKHFIWIDNKSYNLNTNTEDDMKIFEDIIVWATKGYEKM